MKERKYSDQINIENEQKLRALVAELPLSVGNILSVLSRQRLPVHGLPMPMTLASFFTISMKTMPHFQKWRSSISQLIFWSRLHRWTSKNICNI